MKSDETLKSFVIRFASGKYRASGVSFNTTNRVKSAKKYSSEAKAKAVAVDMIRRGSSYFAEQVTSLEVVGYHMVQCSSTLVTQTDVRKRIDSALDKATIKEVKTAEANLSKAQAVRDAAKYALSQLQKGKRRGER